MADTIPHLSHRTVRAAHGEQTRHFGGLLVVIALLMLAGLAWVWSQQSVDSPLPQPVAASAPAPVEAAPLQPVIAPAPVVAPMAMKAAPAPVQTTVPSTTTAPVMEPPSDAVAAAGDTRAN